jgi:arylsulfatase A-like enzyme
MRHLVFSWMLLTLGFSVAVVPSAWASTQHAKRFNVLFIALDDLRPELGCYGKPDVKSPNIDALASRGLRFDRAYCQLALCNPSRASLLTGRRPETLGVFDLKTFVRDASPDVVTLPELFKSNGYRTLSFGKIFHTTNGNHEDPKSWSEKAWKPGRPAVSKVKGAKAKAAGAAGPKEDDEGAFHRDELPAEARDCGDDDLPDGKIATAAIAALNAEKDKPFFLAVGFNKPHMPFLAPKRYWDLYDEKSISLAPNPKVPEGAPAFASNDASELRRYFGVPESGPIPDKQARHLKHGYYACVSYADAQVGRVIAELDKLGLRDNTIIILWGDHGYQLGEHGTWNKRTNWEICTRVPLIIQVPEQPAASAGKASTALVEFIDIYPTLVELCSLPKPQKLEGRSFTPLLTDPMAAWKPAAYSVYQKNVSALGGTTLGRAMRTDRYRLIEWTGPSGQKPVYELYDHAKDPDENINIANRSEHAELVQTLARQLHEGK